MRAQLRFAVMPALLAALLLLGMPPARAQSTFNFDLPAEPLADALRAVASAAHLDIVFDPRVVSGIEAPPLRGHVTAREALARLLAHTGLESVAVGARTVRIARIAPRRSVGSHENASGAHESDTPAGGDGPYSTTTSKAEAAPKTEEQAQLAEVVVTGTRIAGVPPVSPVVTFGRTAIDESGYGSVGQFLLTVPENFNGGQNAGVVGARGNNLGSFSGAESANLLGLGPDSTLTLIDGHRLAYDGSQNNVDLSLIPLAAVDRIEIMTGGASAIYGSDAVAGVVNVILKSNYQGVTADARYGDVTSGHASQAQYSVLAGHDWGSGNAMVAYEYAHDSPLLASERSFSAGVDQPFYLLPELNRDSVFVTAHQGLTSSIAASLDALYTTRSDVGVFAVGPKSSDHVLYADVAVEDFGVAPEVTVALPGSWQLTFQGNIAEDRDQEVSREFGGITQIYESHVDFQNALRSAGVEATGTAARLPSGPLKVALGAGYRYESYGNSNAATFLKSQPPTTHASRHVRYVYAEANLPLVTPDTTRTGLERLDLSAAFRYERYSDFGAQHTPKVGIAYAPLRSLTFRASWSESFRAPELEDVYGLRQLFLESTTYLGGPPGTTTLLTYDANLALGPESATSRTVSLDFTPSALPQLKITPTYFYIHYSGRIVVPVQDLTDSFTNPEDAPFYIAHPSPAQVQAVVSQASLFNNETGMPYDPATVAYILNDVPTNASVQRVHGVDLSVEDAWPVLGGDLELAGDGVWLTLIQRLIPTAPELELTGTIFNPPRFKTRESVTWRRAGWAITAAYNYVSPEWDNSTSPEVRVASFSTVDAQVSYGFDGSRIHWLRGLKASVSVQNLFDRAPPFVAAASTTYPGLGYDSTNASPLGRFVSLYVSKSW